MTDIYIDPVTGDIDLTVNTMRLTESIEELTRQRLSITLSTYQGEWFDDIDLGIPYLKNDNNPVQGLGVGTKGFLDAVIKAKILEKEEITSFKNYVSTLEPTTGALVVSFTAITNTGSTIVVST